MSTLAEKHKGGKEKVCLRCYEGGTALQSVVNGEMEAGRGDIDGDYTQQGGIGS